MNMKEKIKWLVGESEREWGVKAKNKGGAAKFERVKWRERPLSQTH